VQEHEVGNTKFKKQNLLIEAQFGGPDRRTEWYRAAQVIKQFRTIAATSGNKSQDRKRGVITTMLAASKPQEAAYLMRALQVLSSPCDGTRPLRQGCT